MNRNLLMVIIAVLALALLAAGCLRAAPLQTYREAVQRTGEINSGNKMVQFSHSMEFSGPGLTEEVKKNLEMFQEAKGGFTVKYDREKKYSVIDGHVDMMGMGFDLKTYRQGNTMIMMLPMFTKYLVVDVKPGPDQSGTWAEAGRKLEKVWEGMVTADNIARDKDRLVSTPEGEVRTTAYNITPNPEEIKRLIAASVDIITSDNGIRAAILDNIIKYGGEKGLTRAEAEKFLDEFMENFRRDMDDLEIKSFKHTVFIDKDNRLVAENSRAEASMTSEGITVHTVFEINIQHWAFGAEVTPEVPEVNEHNSFRVEKFDQNTPRLFEGMLKNTQWKAGQ